MKEEMDMAFLEEMPEDEEMMDDSSDFLDDEMAEDSEESPLAEFSDEDILAEYEKRGLAEAAEEVAEDEGDELDFEEEEEDESATPPTAITGGY